MFVVTFFPTSSNSSTLHSGLWCMSCWANDGTGISNQPRIVVCYRRHKATPVTLPSTNLASVPKRKVRAVGGEDMLNGFKFVSGIGGFAIIPWLGGRHPQVMNIDTHIHIFIRYTTKRPEKNEKNGGKNSTTLMVWSQKKNQAGNPLVPKKSSFSTHRLVGRHQWCVKTYSSHRSVCNA